MATRGVTPKAAAVSALVTAMRASSSALGSTFTAQSPYTNTWTDTHQGRPHCSVLHGTALYLELVGVHVLCGQRKHSCSCLSVLKGVVGSDLSEKEEVMEKFVRLWNLWNGGGGKGPPWGGGCATYAERMIQGKWGGSVMGGKVVRRRCIPCQEGT